MKKLIPLFCFIFLLAFAFSAHALLVLGSGIEDEAEDEWRKSELTVNASKVPGDLTNFPILLTEDNLPSECLDKDGSYPAEDGGGNIQFWDDEAGSNRYACEIVTFVTDNDPASGEAEIHVGVLSVNGTVDTTFWIWYAKSGESQPAANASYGSEAVWDANFKMVQHMEDATTSTVLDSTSNDSDGTKKGANEPNEVAGKIGKGQDYDGDDDDIDIGLSTHYAQTTFSTWVKADAGYGETYPRLVDKREAGAEVINLCFTAASNRIDFTRAFSGDNGSWKTPDDSTSTGSWYYIVLTYDDSSDTNNPLIYINKTSQSITEAVPPTGTASTNADDYIIGNRGNAERTLDGIMDETRISNTIRSSNWIEAEYNNQNDPSSFVTAGTPSGVDPPTVTTQAVDGIHDNNATGHGTITALGGENCSKRGFCWNTAPEPTINDNNATESGSFGVGAFSLAITGLSANTTYYVKALAEQTGGIGYGDQVQFNSTGSPPPGCSWYVDTGGDDGTGNGTSGNPWLTVVYALSQSNFGESICVNDGTYDEARLHIPVGVSLRSTSENATLVTIQPNYNVGLYPFVNLITASPGSNGNQTISYLTFDGDTGTYSGLVGIEIENRDNVIITHCDIKDFTGSSGSCGVMVESTEVSHNISGGDYWPDDPQTIGTDTNIDALWPANPVENFELSYCTIINCGYRTSLSSGSKYSAIWPFHLKNSSIHHNTINTEDSRGEPIKGTSALLHNVDIYNNDITSAYYTDRPSWAIEVWYLRNGCEIYNNTLNAPLSISSGKETKIYNNTIIATWSSEIQYIGGMGIEFILQGEGEIYSNYLEKAGYYGIVLGLESNSGNRNRTIRNVKVYNNIIYNAWSKAIYVENRNTRTHSYTVQDIEVYNNTCDDLVSPYTYHPILHVESEATGGGSVTTDNIKFINNICTNGPGYAGKTEGTITNLSIDHNLFYNNNNDDWQGFADTNPVTTNPVFVAAGDKPAYFKLDTGSNAIDAGTNSVNGTVTDDYDGVARPVGTTYNIGAYENE